MHESAEIARLLGVRTHGLEAGDMLKCSGGQAKVGLKSGPSTTILGSAFGKGTGRIVAEKPSNKDSIAGAPVDKLETFSFGQFRLIQGTLSLDAPLASLFLGLTYRTRVDLRLLKAALTRQDLRALVAFLRRERTRLERQLPGITGLPQQMRLTVNRRPFLRLRGSDPVTIIIQISGARTTSPSQAARASRHAYLEGLILVPPIERQVDAPPIDVQGEFLRRMSHELRTPLHAICGIAQILKDKEWTEPSDADAETLSRRRLLDQLLNAGEQMQDLVGQLLDLSYIRKARLSSVPQPFNLNELLMQCWQPYYARSEEKGIGFEFESDLEEETTLVGDWRLLFQLIRLLLSNAVKFTDRGRVVLSISHTLVGQGLFELALEVKDTGIGIAPEDVETIFKPFAQANQGDTRSHGGSGLGLFLCEQIAQALGTHLSLSSRAGFSTCFEAKLTFRTLDKKPEAETRMGATRQVFADWRLDNRLDLIKILAVDDNELNLAIVRAFLKDTETQLTTVTSGQEALTEFSSEFYDVVLMDLQMPELDGYQTTARMRHIERAFSRERSVIIAVSASCFSEDMAKARASGCDDHIAKPLSRQNLFTALERHQIKILSKKRPRPVPPPSPGAVD